MATCYRHPDRETNVSCSRCARPICPDCMTPSPVGMRCPECAGDRTRATGVRFGRREAPYATYALIALNVDRLHRRDRGRGRGGDARGRRLADQRRRPLRPRDLAGRRVVPDRHQRLPARRASAPLPQHVRALHPRRHARARDRPRAPGRRSTSSRCSRGPSARCCSTPDELTVGASGAVYGLMAATVAHRPRPRRRAARVPDRALDRDQPRVHVQHPRHQHRRPPRRARRRRDRGAADPRRRAPPRPADADWSSSAGLAALSVVVFGCWRSASPRPQPPALDAPLEVLDRAPHHPAVEAPRDQARDRHPGVDAEPVGRQRPAAAGLEACTRPRRARRRRPRRSPTRPGGGGRSGSARR